MIYFCCDDRRRNAVQAHSFLNGIDFLEVSDNAQDPVDIRQRFLLVHFVKPIAANTLTIHNIRIEGGERIRNIDVVSVSTGASASPPNNDPNVLVVEVSEAGDFSSYTLRLVKGPGDLNPPTGIDQILSSIDFSFKVLCPSDFDCEQVRICPDETPTPPDINYLAKDFSSFKQLILDRMAVLTPGWIERNAADLGIVLVELLAYVGDYLSYQQDAVATEAYLGTARKRASVRRHARLVDYPMHDGRNSRVWVQLVCGPNGNGVTIGSGSDASTTKLLTRVDKLSNVTIIPQNSSAFDTAINLKPQVFELIRGIALREAHNQIKFYTWGSRDCCLAKGSTAATLDGAYPNLKVGDVLIFKEQRGPKTGAFGDLDPAHRCAVLLTKVEVTSDLLGGRFKPIPDNNPTPITEIEWAAQDALPFSLCVSSVVGTDFYDDVSVALGNIVLADHGMTFVDDTNNTSLYPDTVPAAKPSLVTVIQSTTDRCADPVIEQTPPRYRPQLKRSPLTCATSYDLNNLPASASAVINLTFDDPEQFPLPSITLTEQNATGTWKPARDLLGSGPEGKQFVGETETDGTAYLRFGDGQTGLRPAEATRFLATYRIGNGNAGNVGPDAISHIVSSDPSVISDLSNPVITAVTNPMAASGGIEPETIEQVRQNAPTAFRKQQRAVTPSDYEEIVTREDVETYCGVDVQRAAATLRWTGSWHTMFLTIDRMGGKTVDTVFKQKLRNCIERFRMAGQDLEVDSPLYVSLEIEMTVCIKNGYFFSDVEQALLQVFSNQVLTDGRKGVFHPDNFTFGQPVFLSSIYAGAQAITGIDSVNITKFQRQGIDSDVALNSGQLDIGRLEIARLDNDPNFPEHGVFTIKRG